MCTTATTSNQLLQELRGKQIEIKCETIEQARLVFKVLAINGFEIFEEVEPADTLVKVYEDCTYQSISQYAHEESSIQLTPEQVLQP